MERFIKEGLRGRWLRGGGGDVIALIIIKQVTPSKPKRLSWTVGATLRRLCRANLTQDNVNEWEREREWWVSGDLSHVQVFPRASRRILIGVGNKRCSSRTVRVACRDKIFNGKNGKENLLEDAINSDETLINFGDKRQWIRSSNVKRRKVHKWICERELISIREKLNGGQQV